MTEAARIDTLLVGIDAGCLSVFDRLFEEGRIPTIERLSTEGTAVPMTSQIPPWTPSAWPSLYTGVNPGKHGVMGFVGYEGYDWHVVTHTEVRQPSLWALLSQQNLTSVVVNVPVTHPPRAFDGALIPGFIGPENPDCHPEDLLEEVRSAIGEYRVYPRYTRGTDRLSDAEKMDEYDALIRMRGAAFRYLLNEYAPSFGFLQFQKTDTVFHEFDGDEEKVNRVYSTVDDELDAIIEEYQPRRVFLASDHGIGRYSGPEFRVNEYLRRHGYVEATNSGKGMPSWSPIRNELREGNRVSKWEPSWSERFAGQAAKFGFTASRMKSVLEKLGLLGVVRRVVPANVARTANVQVDFEHSIAYMRARTEFGIRLNVIGREPNGVVSPADYEDLRDELIKILRDAATPDGTPVFEEVCSREQYFTGAAKDEAVDIVTVPSEMDLFLSEQLGDALFSMPDTTWDHKMDGVFIAWGEGIDVEQKFERANLLDVAPTVLAAMDIPASEHMDGSVLPIIDEVGYTDYSIAKDSREPSSPAGEEVEKRLADLGYL